MQNIIELKIQNVCIASYFIYVYIHMHIFSYACIAVHACAYVNMYLFSWI